MVGFYEVRISLWSNLINVNIIESLTKPSPHYLMVLPELGLAAYILASLWVY